MSANEFLENSSHPQPAGGHTNTASNAEGVRALQARNSGIPSSNTSLFPRFDDDNSSLAMRPLLIAGMVRPLADGDGGINLDVVEDNDAGILCAINPYIGMQLGDQYDVHWGAQIVYSGKVQPDEVNKQLLFYLPKTIAQPGWVEECYYQLTRFGESTPDDPSVALRLLVKLTRPGGRDKAPHLPDGHSELHPAQLPKDVVQQGIDAEWAKKGVPVTIPFYPEMALGDTILVHWGSANNILAPHTVTQDEVDGKNPIVIIADQAAILAGGDSDALVVRYNIHDVVWNWAVRHSQSNRVRVDAGGWRLEAPVIKESINGIITIKNLKKEDVTVQVHVQPEDFTLGDTVTLSFIGTPAAGKPLIHSTSKIVVSIPSILELKVPYAHIRAIAMGRADASYVLKRQNGEPLLSSKRTFAQVVGDVLMLPEPTIRELSGNILAPDEARATVGISYLGIRSGDVINLRWTGTRSNGTPYAHPVEHIVSDNDAKAGIVTLHVDNEHISVLNNGTLDVSYRVSNDQVALYGVSESEPLLAKVEKIRATLPVPVVEEADPPDMLDPSKDPVHLLIEAQTAKDDILTYYWRADNPQGSTSDRVTITTVIEGQPLRFRLDKQFVASNIGTTVKVSYVLRRASTGRYEYSETLDLLIAGRVSPTIDSVVDAKGVEIPDNGVTFDKSVKVSGKASPSQKIRLRDGTSTLHEPSSNGSGDWSQVVSSLSVKAYNLTALALYGDGPASPLRTFTVAQTVTPTIANVTDTKGTVANGGTTFDRTVTVSGKASPSQKIRLRDGNSTLHEPSSNGSGDWSQVVSSLSVKAYNLTALALYGDGPASPLRTLTVAQTVTPTIANVTDTKGTVANGGTTFDRTVTVSGKASPSQKIRLRDGNSTLHEPSSNGSGDWSQIVSSLSVKAYNLTALALYGDGPASTPRTFEVAALEENFDKLPEQSIGIGGRIETPLMTMRVMTQQSTLRIIALSRAVIPYPKPLPQPGKMENNVLFLDTISGVQTTIRLDFKTSFSKVSFWYNQTKSTTSVYFYSGGTVLGSKPFTQSETPSTLVRMEGSYTGITAIEIRGGNDAYLLDHFTFVI